ncbi:unnamed protein product, partial [Diamesa serratosioi]
EIGSNVVVRSVITSVNTSVFTSTISVTLIASKFAKEEAVVTSESIIFMFFFGVTSSVFPNNNNVGLTPIGKLSRRQAEGIPGLEVVVVIFLAATHFSNSILEFMKYIFLRLHLITH